MIQHRHADDIRATLPCGSEIIIARAPRKVVKAYLDRNGYKWDKQWELWSNGKDADLRWGSTIYGHTLWVA